MTDMYVLVDKYPMDLYSVAMPEDDTWHNMQMGDEVHTYTNWQWLARRLVDARKAGHIPVVYRLVPLESYEKDQLVNAIIDAHVEMVENDNE